MFTHAKTGEPDDSWWAYYVALAKGRRTTTLGLARQARLNPSLLTRWKTGSQPTVDSLRKLSHLTGVPIVDLLVAAGHLEPDEVQANPVTLVSNTDHPADVRTAIESDDTLSAGTKRHLLAILDAEEGAQD